jgi:phage-related holin
MKSASLYLILSLTTIFAFTCTYLLDITLSNVEQYFSVFFVIVADGFFGIIAGVKREGFKTYKALKIIKTLIFWAIMLTAVLTIEQSFPGTSWLSETLIAPFLTFQLISVVKNASMGGFISNDLLNTILDSIDKHKGIRS